MISASIALDVIELPQVGPTIWMFMLLVETWNAFSSAAATFWVAAEVSEWVCTVHWCSFGLEVYCTLASPPPALVTTRAIVPCSPELADGKVKLDPPVNSREKFSPRTASAMALTSTMRPEMEYHIR